MERKEDRVENLLLQVDSIFETIREINQDEKEIVNLLIKIKKAKLLSNQVKILNNKVRNREE